MPNDVTIYETDSPEQHRALVESLKKLGSRQMLEIALEAVKEAEKEKGIAQKHAKKHELKAKFADRVLDVENSFLDENDAAKRLNLPGLGPHNLYAWLRSIGILMNDSRNWNLPYQRYIDAGYFKVVGVPFLFGRTGDVGIHRKIKVSQKGLKYISDRWEKERVNDNDDSVE